MQVGRKVALADQGQGQCSFTGTTSDDWRGCLVQCRDICPGGGEHSPQQDRKTLSRAGQTSAEQENPQQGGLECSRTDDLMEPPHPSGSPQALRLQLGAGQSSLTAPQWPCPRSFPMPSPVHCSERQRVQFSLSSPSLCPPNHSLQSSELSQHYLSSLPHLQLPWGAVGGLLPWTHWRTFLYHGQLVNFTKFSGALQNGISVNLFEICQAAQLGSALLEGGLTPLPKVMKEKHIAPFSL